MTCLFLQKPERLRVIDEFYNLLLRTDVLRVQMAIAVVLDVAIIVFFFMKSSRDESGKAIIGRSSIVLAI